MKEIFLIKSKLQIFLKYVYVFLKIVYKNLTKNVELFFKNFSKKKLNKFPTENK